MKSEGQENGKSSVTEQKRGGEWSFNLIGFFLQRLLKYNINIFNFKKSRKYMIHQKTLYSR